MNLHLFTDSFFVNQIVQKCETYGEDHYFVVFAPSVKYITHPNVHHYKSYHHLKKSNFPFGKVSKVFIHYLGGYAVDFVLDNKDLAPYYWFFWGADGYSLKSVKNDLLLNKTKVYSTENASFYKRLRWKILKKILKFDSKKKEALKNIKYCCTWVKGDYQLIKDLGFPHLKFYFFSYLSEKELFNEELPLKEIDFKNLRILAGNSLNVTNNHFEIIDFIKNVLNDKSEVIFPLSYSGSASYRDKITLYAKENCLNAKFLKDFIPMEKYLAMINNCDIVIFLHLRQQAANNSLSLLWMGKILIMHPASTLFNFFKEQGLSVISMDNITSINDLKQFHKDHINRIEVNRKKLKQLFSEDKIAKMYQQLFV